MATWVHLEVIQLSSQKALAPTAATTARHHSGLLAADDNPVHPRVELDITHSDSGRARLHSLLALAKAKTAMGEGRRESERTFPKTTKEQQVECGWSD